MPPPPDTTTIPPSQDHAAVPARERFALLRLMLLQRLIEDRVMNLYRQGRISGSVYTGRGQEAVAAAIGLALHVDDVCAPLNRELACHLARGITPTTIFANFLGRSTGPTEGRDGNMHFGSQELGIFPLVSMLGDLASVTVGAALAFKRRSEPRVALTFIGDGAFATGDVHEALGLAGVLKVPAVFVIQNNCYAYSTPIAHHMVNTNLTERITGGWSIPCQRVDGTDALATLVAARDVIEAARAGHGPQALEALTLRGHGHAAHDDGSYVPQSLRESFADPIDRLISRLRRDGCTSEQIEQVRSEAIDDVADGLQIAERAPPPDPTSLTTGVYSCPFD
jgi:TPP-dependent pyruvate/acetoin dehydrogenase alpha subunit